MKSKRFLYLFSILLLIIGIVSEPSLSIFSNLLNLINGKDGLITDYFIKGSQGAAFLNAGLVGLISTTLFTFTDSKYDGIDTGAVMFMMAFSFFGKNLFNMWPIVFGGYLYMKLHPKESTSDILQTTLFSTCIAPLISEILFVFETPIFLNLMLALIVGVSIGYIINVVADHARPIHKNYSLFNTGFVIGVIGTIYVAVLRSFGFEINAHLIWDENPHLELYRLFTLIFLVMGIYGLYQERSFKNFKLLIKNTYKKKDFITHYGLDVTLINMSLTGLVSIALLFILKIPLNGPILGGLLSIVGYSTAGKNVVNILPSYIGAFLASLTMTWNLSDPTPALIMLYLSGLAPVTSTFGFIPGIIAVYITAAVALNTGVLHGGLNLYNTGYAMGFVCAILIPIYERIFKNDKVKELNT